MNVSVFVLVLFKIFLVSSAPESPDLIGDEKDGQLHQMVESPKVKSPNFSYPVLEERVEKKKHLFVLLEEEEDDEMTSLRVNPDSQPPGENPGKVDQRFGYSHTVGNQDGGPPFLEDQLVEDPNSEDQVNGTHTGPKKPSLVHTNRNYIIPVIICLGLVLAGLMFFAYYFKWTERSYYNSTEYNFLFFKITVTEKPLAVPDY